MFQLRTSLRSQAAPTLPGKRDAAIHRGSGDFEQLGTKPPARTVTPEVAGSSPVAPVSQKYLQIGCCVVSPGVQTLISGSKRAAT
jgi:hypothetical protein